MSSRDLGKRGLIESRLPFSGRHNKQIILRQASMDIVFCYADPVATTVVDRLFGLSVLSISTQARGWLSSLQIVRVIPP